MVPAQQIISLQFPKGGVVLTAPLTTNVKMVTISNVHLTIKDKWTCLCGRHTGLVLLNKFVMTVNRVIWQQQKSFKPSRLPVLPQAVLQTSHSQERVTGTSKAIQTIGKKALSYGFTSTKSNQQKWQSFKGQTDATPPLRLRIIVRWQSVHP